MLDDVELFLKLNEEYDAKRTIPTPTKYDPESMQKLGLRRASELEQRNRIRGKRVLEIGCGFGETARSLAKDFGCSVVGVDITPSLQRKWAELGDCGVDFRLFDVSREDASVLGKFDFIYSNATLEHVVHPFALLSSLVRLIPPGGRMHFNMGLHRGTMGSHLYRDVFFPWPHLVFTESTFERFYERIGKPKQRPVWINHITAAQWLEIFDALGLHAEAVWYHCLPIDLDFYNRFEDILSRYPMFDLERDLMFIDLVKPPEEGLLDLVEPTHPAGSTLRRVRFERLRKEIDRVEEIATIRLQELREQAVEVQRLGQRVVATETFRGVIDELEQKVARLQTIEERLNKDLRGVRTLARAVSWSGSTLRALIEPPVSAVRAAMSGAAGSVQSARTKASSNGANGAS